MRSKQELNMQLNEISEELFQDADRQALVKASEAVRSRYRDKTIPFQDLEIRTIEEARSYVAWRFPVTAMVIFEVLHRLREAAPDFEPVSVLDIGAGPAVSVLPVVSHFPQIRDYSLLEEQSVMQKTGEMILQQLQGQLPASLKLNFINSNFQSRELPKAELVLASYVVNEFSARELEIFSRKLSETGAKAAVLIVPGTPEHFRKLTQLRNLLLKEGYSIAAPCTYTGTCQMEGGTDWCHFYERVQRSSLLRQLKSGELAYEDEKFSYLVVVKNPTEDKVYDKNDVRFQANARIIRHPMIHKGYREVTLCSSRGITLMQFTKGKHKVIYKTLKDKGWGDLLDLAAEPAAK